MRFLFLFLVLPSIIFAQYGKNLIANDYDMSVSGVEYWDKNNTFSTLGKATHNSSQQLHMVATASQRTYYDLNNTGSAAIPVTTDSTQYRFISTGSIVGSTALRLYVLRLSDFVELDQHIFSSSSEVTYSTTFTFYSAGGATNIALKPAILAAGEGYLKSVYINEIIDTLWIDGINGSDTSNDTVKTLTEAFVNRGAHDGGVFITAAGTYNESITIDNDFEYWKAEGGNVNITAVDFNNKTLKVDYEIWANIGSKSNTSNVDVVISDTILKTLRRRRGFSGWMDKMPKYSSTSGISQFGANDAFTYTFPFTVQ